MTLPELALQNLYGELAWAVAAATLVFGALPERLQRSRRVAVHVLAIAMLLMLLPGQLSPSYWIVLAFQWPSALLVGLCLLKLAKPWLPHDAPARSPALLPLPLAATIALFGAALYMDALGLLSLGLYYWGFGPQGAPLLALVGAAVCAAGIVHGRWRGLCAAALGALILFSVLRLPTGNLWDALLDPFLWLWAVASLASRCWQRAVSKPI